MLPDRRYKKPPLIEVLADFYFESSEDVDWDPKRLANFSEEIKSLGLPDTVDEPLRHGSATRTSPPRRRRRSKWPWRHRFASPDGNQTVQVGENFLVVNQFPPYYGWRKFKEQALTCYNAYLRTWPAQHVAAAGLHYVDVVKVPEESFFIDDYFNLYPVLPDAEGLFPLRHVAMSCETVGTVEGDMCSIAFHQRPSADPDVMTFRFRWDYLRVSSLTPEMRAVEEWLDRAHDYLRLAFRSTFTDKCEQLFDPED